MRELWALVCRNLRELWARTGLSTANLPPAPAPAMPKSAGISRARVLHFGVPKFWPDILLSQRVFVVLPIPFFCTWCSTDLSVLSVLLFVAKHL